MKPTPQQKGELIARAREARRNAYAPYSNYAVGAALLAQSGDVYIGVNVENAAYPVGMCAERTALFSAVAQGERAFRAIAVVTTDGGTPCGSCRQALSEFGLETLVWIADGNGRVVAETTVGDLLPKAFGPANLRRT
ncbi:MAG: cytidine deaminase [Chloroflexota bacterium]